MTAPADAVMVALALYEPPPAMTALNLWPWWLPMDAEADDEG